MNNFKPVMAIVGCGFLLFVLLLVAVFFSGQTFGQRCKAQGHAEGSQAWRECINELRHGSHRS